MTKNNFNANLAFPLLPPLIANDVPQFGHLHFCTFNSITQLSFCVPSIANGFLFKKGYRLSRFYSDMYARCQLTLCGCALGLLNEATCSEVSMSNLRFPSDSHGLASPCSSRRNLNSPEIPRDSCVSKTSLFSFYSQC